MSQVWRAGIASEPSSATTTSGSGSAPQMERVWVLRAVPARSMALTALTPRFSLAHRAMFPDPRRACRRRSAGTPTRARSCPLPTPNENRRRRRASLRRPRCFHDLLSRPALPESGVGMASLLGERRYRLRAERFVRRCCCNHASGGTTGHVGAFHFFLLCYRMSSGTMHWDADDHRVILPYPARYTRPSATIRAILGKPLRASCGTSRQSFVPGLPTQ